MSATRPFFISQKEINLVDHMNEELIDEIVGQSVDIYKVATEHTPSKLFIYTDGSQRNVKKKLLPCSMGRCYYC